MKKTMTHLEYNMPWDILDSIIEVKRTNHIGVNDRFSYKSRIKDTFKLKQFCKAFIDIVNNISDSYRPLPEDYKLYFPGIWENFSVRSFGNHICHIDSICSCYIILNMILLNSSKYLPLFDGVCETIFSICLGNGTIKHPAHMVQELEKLFVDKYACKTFEAEVNEIKYFKRQCGPYNNYKLKTLDPTMKNNIIHMCNLYFKCMYMNNTNIRRSEENGRRFFHDGIVEDVIRRIFSIIL